MSLLSGGTWGVSGSESKPLKVHENFRGEIPDWFYNNCYAVIRTDEGASNIDTWTYQGAAGSKVVCYCSETGFDSDTYYDCGREWIVIISPTQWERWQSILATVPGKELKTGVEGRLRPGCLSYEREVFNFRTHRGGCKGNRGREHDLEWCDAPGWRGGHVQRNDWPYLHRLFRDPAVARLESTQTAWRQLSTKEYLSTLHRMEETKEWSIQGKEARSGKLLSWVHTFHWELYPDKLRLDLYQVWLDIKTEICTIFDEQEVPVHHR